MEVLSASTENTKKLAEKIASDLVPGTVLALYGDLGAGKTTFVRYLTEALGIPSRVQSPTFVIARKYEGGEGRIKKINHVDLYRLTDLREAEEIGLSEMMQEEDSLTVIEWPEQVEPILPLKTIKIYFSYVDESTRKIKVSD